MQAHECLFYCNDIECNDHSKEEHIVQEGLGGTLSSNNLICDSCNKYFSREVDLELVNFYEPITKILAPFLPGDIKRKKKSSELISDNGERHKIEYIKGKANLSKITKSYSHNGELKTILAPTTTSPTTLARIANGHGVTGKAIQTLLVTEHFTNAREGVCLTVNAALIRAILLDILELADYASFTKNLPNIARHQYLSELRYWVRVGKPIKHLPLRNIFYSFAPISDFLDTLFEQSTFSHKLIICFDHEYKVLILIAQFFNTMPWVFVIDNISVHNCSVSILYKKALLDGTDQFFVDSKQALIDIRDIRWRVFVTTSADACEFARIKFEQEFQKQHARAYYESDLRDDDYITKRLNYYCANSCDKENASIDAISKLIESRYQTSEHLSEIIKMTKNKAAEIFSSSAGIDIQRVLIYRECLKCIKEKYGYPKVL